MAEEVVLVGEVAQEGKEEEEEEEEEEEVRVSDSIPAWTLSKQGTCVGSFWTGLRSPRS